MVKRYSVRGLMGLVLALGVLLTGCGGTKAPAQENPGTKPAETQERVVKHALGETKIKGTPQKVVVLDTGELDIVLALGVKPVGAVLAPAESDFPAYLKGEKTEGIQKVGTIAEPNLEAIAALQPDLILTNVLRHEKIYDKLSQIAPTVVGIRPNNWKDNLKLFGEALNKTAEADKALTAYNQRLAEFKQKMGDKLAATKVSLIRSMPDHARIYQNDSFSGSILKDAGLGRPASQDKAAIFEKVNEERIPDMDGDVIFAFYYGREKADSLAKFFKHPLWAQLNAVKANQVHEVNDGHWALGLGPVAANLVVDDLFKYLVK